MHDYTRGYQPVGININSDCPIGSLPIATRGPLPRSAPLRLTVLMLGPRQTKLAAFRAPELFRLLARAGPRWRPPASFWLPSSAFVFFTRCVLVKRRLSRQISEAPASLSEAEGGKKKSCKTQQSTRPKRETGELTKARQVFLCRLKATAMDTS